MNAWRKNNWRRWPARYSLRNNSKLTRAGEIVERVFPQVNRAEQKGGEAAAFTFGNVWSRIWRNTSRDGTIYYRISLHRIDTHDGESIVRNNFRPADLNDVIRAARRCQIWLSETHK